MIEIENEEKDIWKLLLERNKFREAYNICKKYDSPFLQHVLISYKSYFKLMNKVGGLLADDYFAKKNYSDAAVLYVDTPRTFEEIALKFVYESNGEGL